MYLEKQANHVNIALIDRYAQCSAAHMLVFAIDLPALLNHEKDKVGMRARHGMMQTSPTAVIQRVLNAHIRRALRPQRRRRRLLRLQNTEFRLLALLQQQPGIVYVIWGMKCV